MPLPFTPGSEAADAVEEVGAEIQAPRYGDRAAAHPVKRTASVFAPHTIMQARSPERG